VIKSIYTQRQANYKCCSSDQQNSNAISLGVGPTRQPLANNTWPQ